MVTRTTPSGTGTTGTSAPKSSGAQIIHNDSVSDGPGPEVMDADTLIGDSVVNAAGEDLGDVKAIMLDVGSGRIAYAVLSFGGFLGMGDKLFAIPWSALTLDTRNKCFILDVAKERLENAPGFDKDHWPAMADANWARQLHEYYNVRPYWDNDIPRADPRTSAGSVLREPKSY